MSTCDTTYLETMTLAQLKAEAKRIFMYNYTSLNKAELLQKVKDTILANNRRARIQEERNAVILRAEEEHRLTRTKTVRQQENPDEACLAYPYQFLDEYIESPNTLVCQTEPEDISDFPANVDHYYWIHEGANDEQPWIALCRLTNGVYVFYKGECDYTGFDCQGHMELYASKHIGELIEYGMSIGDYRLYIEETRE